MRQQKLLKLVQTLILLKTKLQCPICLEVMQEVRELNCGHKYCEGCYDIHKTTQKPVACPLCKKVIKRRSLVYKDSHASSLGKFIVNVCKKIEDVYKCEVEQLQRALCAENSKPQVKDDILKQNDASNTDTSLPSTSKMNTKKRKMPELQENCEDAFDKLKHAPVVPSSFNKNALRRVYANKNKLDKEPEYNILEFHNQENKTAVLRWLNDTMNLFDRLTQTQNFEEENMSPPIVDLTSISQEKENENDFKITKNVRKLRAKSLDIEVKKPIPKDPKRYSDGGGSVIMENYNIEDINTEEEEVVKKVEKKVLLDLIEDEFLDKLNKELQNNEENEGQPKTKKKPRKSSKQIHTPSSATSTTGWDRMTKIKKTIKKSEKAPKQLNITLLSTHGTVLKNDKEMNIPKPVEENASPLPSNFVMQPVKPLDSVKSEENRITEKPTSYDFNKLEDYISKNIKLIDTPLDSTASVCATDHAQKTIADNEVDLIAEKEHTEPVEKRHSKYASTDPRAYPRRDQIEVKGDNIIVDDCNVKIPPAQKIPNTSIHVTSKENIEFHDDEEIFDPSHRISSHDHQNIIDKSNKANRTEVFTLKPDDIISGGVTICVPLSQKTEGDCPDVTDASVMVSPRETKSTTTTGKKIICDDYDINELYNFPTQKINHKCKHETVNFERILENATSTDDLLHLLEENLGRCLANLKSTADVEIHLHKQQILLAKLRSLNEEKNDTVPTNNSICNAATQTFVETVNEEVQTDNKRSINNVTTQTTVETVNKEVQTKIKCAISNVATQTIVVTVNEGIQTVNKRTFNTEVQTEALHCSKCNGVSNQANVKLKEISQSTKAALEAMVSESNVNFELADQNAATNIKRNTRGISRPSTQNEIFSTSFDNLNFETQELVRNQGVILRYPEVKSNVRNDPVTQTKKKVLSMGAADDLPGSVLVCSLDTTNPTCSKKIDKKLTNDADTSRRFKRIRMPTSDSDSEGEVDAKRNCNRFVRDDLTIEIHTNVETTDGREREKNSDSQNSDNVNYDDYLAQIMKKYDDGNFSTNSSGKKFKALSPRREIINDDMSVQCEEMIQNAKRNVPEVKKTNASISSSKDSFQTASQSINNNFDSVLAADDMFMDERNLLKLDQDIREYEKSTKEPNSEISDIIGATEELEPLPKRPKFAVHRDNLQSAGLAGPSDNLMFTRQKSNNSIICQELNDSLDAADLKIIQEQIDLNEANTSTKEKIKIIENVKIKSQIRKEDIREDEDLFSDEDIVETTPRKKVDSFAERSILSQIDNIVNLPIRDNLPTPLSSTENFDFNFEALPPPPDFQDTVQSVDNAAEILPDDELIVVDDDITTANLNKSSLTPDKLSQFIINERKTKDYMSQILSSSNIQYNNNGKEDQENNLSLTPDKLSQFDVNPEPRNMMYNSTAATQRNFAREALGISPIPARKSQQSGIIDMAQTSKYTPLSSVTKTNTQTHTILTSTPKQRSIWNYVKPSQSSEKEITPVIKTKPCIACTRLTKDQIKSISQLTSKKLATYSSNFDPSVTHMIVAVTEDNRVRDYTIKFVSAVAAGIWVLRFEWIEDCLSKNCIVPEESYEALDISGLPGPRTARLTRKRDPLFSGYKFYCTTPFISTTQQEIEEIIKMLDGKVLRHIKGLLENDGHIGLIIGEGHGTQDFEHYERWVELYKTVTVDIEWLSKCVGQYKLISIRPYVWCSEDNLGDLGYPAFLTETVPLSFTETF